MKFSMALKPAVLFAAGSAASVASAAPTIDDTLYNSSVEGTEITLVAGNGPQYVFQTREVKGFYGFYDTYNLDGRNGAQVAPFGVDSAEQTRNIPQELYGSTVETGSTFTDPKARAIVSDQYYGLRFNANGDQYVGFAGVINGGATINQIGFELAAVPEPSTWALMIAGFGGVGLAMRRRRRQAPAALSAVA